jgi:hypothetical protein
MVRVVQGGSSILRHLLGQAMHVAARYDPELVLSKIGDQTFKVDRQNRRDT